MIRLSERLEMIASHVRKGDIVAAIGTDHGKLPLWLYEKGISPEVILTDISEPSLRKAEETAGAAQFGRTVSFRAGDGLVPLRSAEADTVVIAGMGGKLIREILAADPEHTASFSRLILQPRTASGPLRKWLLENGYRIVFEDIAREGRFLPEIITADSPDHGLLPDLAAEDRHWMKELREDDIRLRVPPWIMRAGGHPREFIRMRLRQEKDILENMKKSGTRNLKAERVIALSVSYLEELQKKGTK